MTTVTCRDRGPDPPTFSSAEVTFNKVTVLGNHADRAVYGKRGLVKPTKNPQLAATSVANTFTVATNACFIGRGNLEKVMRPFYEKRPSSVG